VVLCHDGHFRTDRVPVRFHPLEPKDKVMAGYRLVVKVGERLILRDDHRIDPTVVVEIA